MQKYFRRTVLAVLLFSSLRIVGCSGPSISREYDYYEDVTVVRAGPFYLGKLNYVKMDIVVPLMKRRSPEAPRSPPEVVVMNFPGWTFDEVCFVFQGEVVRCRRPGFQEYTIRMKAKNFARIASSGYVAGHFDDQKAEFVLSREQLEVLRKLAAEIGIIEPQR